MLWRRNTSEKLNRFTNQYGDILYDLCTSLAPDEARAQLCFHFIFKKLVSRAAHEDFTVYEREWVLHTAVQVLRKRISPADLPKWTFETVSEERESTPEKRLTRIDQYIRRLPLDDQILIFLKDKHGLPDSVVESCMGEPVGSLLQRRQQAYRRIADRIWEKKSVDPLQLTDSVRDLAQARPSPDLLKNPLHPPVHLSNGADGDPTAPAGSRRLRWQQTPWYVRSSVQGFAVASVVLFVVAMVPKIRSMYERSLERRLDTYQVTEKELALEEILSDRIGTLSEALGQPEAAALLAPGEEGEQDEGSAPGNHEEIPFDEHDLDLEESEDESLGIGNAQMWRFIIKTDSPHEIRPRIAEMFRELKITGYEGKSLEGVIAPGGIQFNVLADKDLIPQLKRELQKLSIPPRLAANMDAETLKAAFTWYKIRYRKRLPNGMVRVIVWLSQT